MIINTLFKVNIILGRVKSVEAKAIKPAIIFSNGQSKILLICFRQKEEGGS